MFFKLFCVSFCALLIFQTLNANQLFPSVTNEDDDLTEQILALANQPEVDIAKLNVFLSAMDLKIRQILGAVDLDRFQSEVAKSIKQILDESNLTENEANDCLTSEQEILGELISAISQETKICLNPIDNISRDLKDIVLRLSEDGDQISNDIKNKINDCADDKSCLENLLEEAKLNVEMHSSNIDSTLEDFRKVANPPVMDFLRCIMSSQTKMYDEEFRIYIDFTKCIDNL